MKVTKRRFGWVIARCIFGLYLSLNQYRFHSKVATALAHGSLTVTAAVPETLSESSFSACLLTMDDYPILTEWLAYHYHVLPLRYLIVATDPRSSVSPKPIFDIWRKHGMIIEEWSDNDFYPEAAREPLPPEASYDMKRMRHRTRQTRFYGSCMEAMRQRKRTWTIFHDTDEFLRFNLAWFIRLNVPPDAIPTLEPPGSMLKFIERSMERNATHLSAETICLEIPRLAISPNESSLEERNHLVPAEFRNLSLKFETLRFRKHNWGGRSGFDKPAKSMMDVSRIGVSYPNVTGVHRLIHRFCPHPFGKIKDSALILNHYTGSWERYFYRDDARLGTNTERSLACFQRTEESATMFDDEIQPWLKGFVEAQGLVKAKELLREAGHFPPRNISTLADEGRLSKNEFDDYMRQKAHGGGGVVCS